MSSGYYPAGSMLNSGIDDREQELQVDCPETVLCGFTGAVEGTVRGHDWEGQCPTCGGSIYYGGVE